MKLTKHMQELLTETEKAFLREKADHPDVGLLYDAYKTIADARALTVRARSDRNRATMLRRG